MVGQLMTAREVSRSLGLSLSQTYCLAHEGTLPFIRIGRSIRFPEAAIKEIAEHGVEAA